MIVHATCESPGFKSEGIRHVVVNGKVTYRDGQLTGEKGWRALYRGSWMPSRPMTAGTTQRRLAASGLATPIGDGGVPLRLAMTLSQAAVARRATGALRLTDPASGDVMEATSLGVLQLGTRWGSVTGTMKRRSSGEERPFVLTYERADPFVEGAPQTVTLALGTDVVRAILK